MPKESHYLADFMAVWLLLAAYTFLILVLIVAAFYCGWILLKLPLWVKGVLALAIVYLTIGAAIWTHLYRKTPTNKTLTTNGD